MSKKLNRILFVVSSLSMGGPQKSLIALLNRLDPSQFEVSLIVLDPTRTDLRPFVPSHISVISTPDTWTAATLPKSNWGQAIGSLMIIVPMTVRCKLVGTLLRSLFKRLPGQQVRQNVWKISGPHLPRIKQEFDIAIGILGLSTYAVVDLVRARHKFHWVRSDSSMLNRDEIIEDQYFSALSGALAVSPQVAGIFEGMYPRMKGRVRVYKNDILPPSGQSLVTAAKHDHPSGLRLLTIARLDPLKGIDLAVEACQRLREMGLNPSWTVLGDGPERDHLEDLIKRRELGHVFSLPGTVLDVQQHLSTADIYVHPSRVEGRSNAVEEARAAGKAIIATRYSTVTDQIDDGSDGLICELTAESLALSIAKLAKEPTLRRRLGQEAVRRYKSEREDPNEMFRTLLETGHEPN